jgi:hypothetical protein
MNIGGSGKASFAGLLSPETAKLKVTSLVVSATALSAPEVGLT